ncbi:unnamed protein product, partial [Pylaiella littoralis]
VDQHGHLEGAHVPRRRWASRGQAQAPGENPRPVSEALQTEQAAAPGELARCQAVAVGSTLRPSQRLLRREDWLVFPLPRAPHNMADTAGDCRTGDGDDCVHIRQRGACHHSRVRPHRRFLGHRHAGVLEAKGKASGA